MTLTISIGNDLERKARLIQSAGLQYFNKNLSWDETIKILVNLGETFDFGEDVSMKVDKIKKLIQSGDVNLE